MPATSLQAMCLRRRAPSRTLGNNRLAVVRSHNKAAHPTWTSSAEFDQERQGRARS